MNWTGDVTVRGSRNQKLGAFSTSLKASARCSMIKWWHLGGKHIIRLEVQGILEHRDVALRTVSAACRLPFRGTREDRFQEFRSHVVSAVGEAFNNIAIHGYKGRAPGVVSIEVAATPDQLSVELRDYGSSYDPNATIQPDLDALPESGLGVFIMKSFMDSVEYTPGEPNVLKLTKLVTKTNGHP
ncbi:MAG TPA: ATP-binding protein [Polyangia bacterium]